MKKKITYILWEFPLISETFISNEILFLTKKHHLEIDIFSNKKPKQEKVHGEVAELLFKTKYLPNLFSWQILSSFFYLVFFYPDRLFRLILLLLKMLTEQSRRQIPYFVAQSIYCFIKASFISKQLLRNPTEHLHSHYAESAAFIAMQTSVLTGIPYSFTMHAHDIFANKNKPFILFLIEMSKFAVTISNYNRQFLKKLKNGIDKKIYVVHCGVDISKFSSSIVQKKKHNKFQFITIARLVEKKGIPDTIEAMADVTDRKELVYKIIGSGPQKADIQERIKEKNISQNIKLMGSQTSEVVREELARSDAFVLSCKKDKNNDMDGIPVALMEAMAMKIPVISTSISGIPELVKKGAGLLSEPNNVSALSANLEKIICMGKKERLKMGEIGRKIIEEEFNIEIETKKLKKLFFTEI